MTRRATLRGDERTPIDQPRADVLICGASFAGLAVARALRGSGLDVLVVDRYEIGERQTSACAVPTPWIEAMHLQEAARQELPCMTFTTPHGRARMRMGWTWTAFDYRTLCQALWAQTEARFEIAKVQGRTGRIVHTDRGDLTATHLVDALGWRRILGPGENVQPPEAFISRGLEVHPDGGGTDLDIWIDRSLVRYGYAWSVPADGEQRVGVGSYEPRDHVKEPTKEIARRLDVPAIRYQGNWFPHRLQPAAEDGVFFAGDAAGHCIPLSGEGIRPALHFGTEAGRLIRTDPENALAAYGAFSGDHRRFYEFAYATQWLMPRLPPRLLTAALKLIGRPRLARPAFAWYLRAAGPASRSATPPGAATPRPPAPAEAPRTRPTAPRPPRARTSAQAPPA
jgi:flavin-dependent dehydrogenase